MITLHLSNRLKQPLELKLALEIKPRSKKWLLAEASRLKRVAIHLKQTEVASSLEVIIEVLKKAGQAGIPGCVVNGQLLLFTHEGLKALYFEVGGLLARVDDDLKKLQV